jgi:arginine:pyruvate transaminase
VTSMPSSGAAATRRFSSLAGRIESVAGGSWRVHRLARERAAAGHDVIVLSLGEPDFAPPEAAVDAAVGALRHGRTRYTPAPGEGSARRAIAARASAQAGREVDQDRVVFFPGSQAALFATMLCLGETGDEVILAEPAYSTYPGVLAAAGATAIEVPLRPEEGFHLRIEDVADAVTPATRAVLLNSPHNPTGAVTTSDELDGIAALCREHRLWLVADEVYASLAWARPHASVLALGGAEQFAVSLGSLSKSHAMTGFRFGWAVAPVELAARLERLLESMLFGSPPFVQDAGVAALADESATDVLRAAYERRARLFCAALENVPVLVVRPPEGGMFVLVDVRGTGLSGDGFALCLLEEEDVAVTPVDGFGPSGAGHVRVSLGAEDERLVEAARRVALVAERITRAT